MKKLLSILLFLFSLILSGQDITILKSTDTIYWYNGDRSSLSVIGREYNQYPYATDLSTLGSFNPDSTLTARSKITDIDGDSCYAMYRFGYSADSIGSLTYLTDWSLDSTFTIPDSLNGFWIGQQTLPKALTGGRTGLKVESYKDSVTYEWAESMMLSYVDINDEYITFTQAQKDTIKAIFNIQSVKDTFQIKYAKTTADFIMIFFNSNITTKLATRTNTKTGRTLRWTFGRKIYDRWDQNNLPADTCKNGWVFVTSVDGFGLITLFDLNTNTFINGFPIGSLPSGLAYFFIGINQFTGNWTNKTLPSGLINFQINSNQFTGDWTNIILPSGLTHFYINSNQFTGDWTNKTLPSGLVYFYVYSNQFTGDWTNIILPSGLLHLIIYSNQFTGDWTNKTLPSGLVYFYVYSNQFTGGLPNITSHITNGLDYKANNNKFILADNVTAFRPAMTIFQIHNNGTIALKFTQAKLDVLFGNMITYYTSNTPTISCSIDISGTNMEKPTSQLITDLQTIYTNAGKVLSITQNP